MEKKSPGTLGFLGCGNLGTAILSGLLGNSSDSESTTLPFSRFMVSVRTDASVTRLQNQFREHNTKVSVFKNENVSVVRDSDVIILATDPVDVELALTGVRGQFSEKLLISVAAGWTREKLQAILYGSAAVYNADSDSPYRPWVIRTLPNVAAVVHQSLTIIETPDAKLPSEYLQLTRSIFNCVGKTMVLPPKLLDAATAVGGSTPAFFAVICEALIDAAVAVGVPRDVAHASIAQSMLGTAHMIQHGMHPGAVKDKGTSPEGCTMSGLMVLEENAVRGHVGRALREAVTVSRLMGTRDHLNDTRKYE
ncbi:pyrroline-5-carboxylate reductase [Pochonia chlamydosporia 170]|uniref:Pyrroline-5-carboxylate reductase n=1 Tax=Pochonia chlamydosporia 170 TaxID=1380566 RepID=A0A179F4I7_METCM|nr:pyrroline-5-carboxylate reductase [Pochonia chlamydosporia 170]OAQ60326.2 pyrroline-5-carboxylate reductase [Pochonia chlamydosporia 170]